MKQGVLVVLILALTGRCGGFARAQESQAQAPYINTWLVAGTFENARDNAGFEYDWLGETGVQPREGLAACGQSWRYFDDRLFSRNYDDYQDLFSYFRIKRNESVRAKIAYAHVYVHSSQDQAAELRVGADNEFKAWLNGEPAASSTEGLPERDQSVTPVRLRQGWNRLLLKIGNQEDGRFGFYARLAGPFGQSLPGITYAVNPPDSALAVSTKAMDDAGSDAVPAAWREWSYVSAHLAETAGWPPFEPSWLIKPSIAVQASAFAFLAEGGTPPYRWSLMDGALPEGLALREDGVLAGTPPETAALGVYTFTAAVTDATGRTAARPFALTLHERPNKWYEEARLTALIHGPESMPADGFDEFAELMKRQGYGIGMTISYNNGRYKYRWPSLYEPDNANGILLGQYKAALEKRGIRFGMYIGNLDGNNHGGPNGALLLVEDAIRRFQPAAFWFDWAGWNGVSLDAIYSMIKTYDPETLVVLNGVPTMSNGDWDVICLEGWGSWGDRIWDKWPFDFAWPKEHTVESWRLVADPAFEYSQGVEPDWQEYLRVQIALIGDGFVANIDHSPTIRTGVPEGGGKLASLDASVVIQAHRKMADWANPEGLPPLHESYTRVNPGPLAAAEWGYNTINLARDAIYLHLLTTPYGKTGMPQGSALTVGPLAQRVVSATCMNTGRALPFEQPGSELVLDLTGLAADPVDTIVKLALEGPHPDIPPPAVELQATPPGNLAWRKPARLLSLDGSHALIASGFSFAHYGNDGVAFTHAQGGMEWPWTYQVDLQESHRVNRIVVRFGQGYPTDYAVQISDDGKTWKTLDRGAGAPNGTFRFDIDPAPIRFVRVQGFKPDGPGQEGGQMAIAELEVYAAE